MDKNAIKRYAVWARRELISRVTQRAALFEITDKHIADADADSVRGRVLSSDEKQQRQALIGQIRAKGFVQVMEEIAYTWFNRFIALRFMEVNGYLPSHVRVFTDDEGAFKPQILTEAIHLELEGLDMGKVYALKNANEDDALFKYLLIVQCNALSAILPGMFQRIADYTELLFPENLLREGSVVEQMVTLIPEEDWTDQVQIIGWLYQYYNTEPKDKVFADLKKNIKISKEKIPAATQLFTPDWIVRYMVENSLGRLWVEGHPAAKEKFLPDHNEDGSVHVEEGRWNYYLEEAEQEPEVQAQLAEIRKGYAALKPEELRVIDPCCGSGHILVYMFDVLVQIYEDYGYTAREAAASIVKHNLWGLDIDERAAQLSYFAVMMKARQYDRRFFSRHLQPHVLAIRESNNVSKEAVKYFCGGDAGLTRSVNTILAELYDAKEYGSILTCSTQDWDALEERAALARWAVDPINNAEPESARDLFLDIYAVFQYKDAVEQLLPLFPIAQALSQQYHVVVTNPPYMGASNMNQKLGEFIKNKFADYKSDFFSAFMVHASSMTKPEGYCGFFAPYVWMFIQSYEKLRNYLYSRCTIETLIQFEYSAFEEATVPVCTLEFKNSHVPGKKGCYFRLTDFRGGMEVQRQKTLEAIADHNCGFYFEQTTDNFSKIPGSPVAYWVGEHVFESFKNTLADVASTKQGFKTGDNERFLRFWFETSKQKTTFQAERTKKWFPCTKGGEFRRWYGNLEYVVNWENDGYDIKHFFDDKGKLRSRPQNLQINFTKELSWSSISSGPISFRYSEDYLMYESKGPVLTPKVSFEEILAYLNSKVYQYFIQIIAPTLDYSEGAVLRVPYKKLGINANQLVNDCISISRLDWDSFETSWDFKQHPLVALKGGAGYATTPMEKWSSTVRGAYKNWEAIAADRFAQIKANEEELNRIFIDIYGLQDELTPEVEDKDVTVRKADLQREIRSLISYAVGCMFGRYSIYKPGLLFAGEPYSLKSFVDKLNDQPGVISQEQLEPEYRTNGVIFHEMLEPDADNIIPICDDEYFKDDIVGRFVRFIEEVYGEETLEQNLRFIADALGGKGSPRDVIRSYFLNDFYPDHLKMYQKRPIYWLFDSGKKNGFKCLIYMHRYQPDTIARIRTDYVHEQQSRYRTAIADLEARMAAASTAERVKLSKQLQKLRDQAEELRVYEEKIHHLADQMIPIDLDDGVKVNYAKFEDVLAKIK